MKHKATASRQNLSSNLRRVFLCCKTRPATFGKVKTERHCMMTEDLTPYLADISANLLRSAYGSLEIIVFPDTPDVQKGV